jgi:hypothetical protein
VCHLGADLQHLGKGHGLGKAQRRQHVELLQEGQQVCLQP